MRIYEFLSKNISKYKFPEGLKPFNYQEKNYKITPLHLAAQLNESPNKSLNILLDLDADCTLQDIWGYTPLHQAAASGFLNNTLDILRHLEQTTENMKEMLDKRDKEGMTPLHRAATPEIAKALMQYGADPFHSRDKLGLNAYEHFLKSSVDNACAVLDCHVSVEDGHVVFDFEPFNAKEVNEKVKTEMHLLNNVEGVQYRNVLEHPLVHAYLTCKWNSMKKFFYINVGFYICFCIAIAGVATISSAVAKEANSTNTTKSVMEMIHDGVEVGRARMPVNLYAFYFGLSVCWLFTGVLILRESLQAIFNFKDYLSFENFLELATVIILCIFYSYLWDDPNSCIHFAAWSVFLSWFELTLLIGRMPKIGIYIYMSVYVMKDIALMFLVYLPTILSFAFVFYIIIQTDVFINPLGALIKVLVMTAGEFEYSAYFTYEKVKDNNGANYSSQLFFIAFYFMSSIALANMILGLTVNKTDELFKEASFIHQEKIIEQVISIEDVILSKIASRLFGNVMKERSQFFPYLEKKSGPNQFIVCVDHTEEPGNRKWYQFINKSKTHNLYIGKNKYQGIKLGIKIPRTIIDQALVIENEVVNVRLADNKLIKNPKSVENQ